MVVAPDHAHAQMALIVPTFIGSKNKNTMLVFTIIKKKSLTRLPSSIPVRQGDFNFIARLGDRQGVLCPLALPAKVTAKMVYCRKRGDCGITTVSKTGRDYVLDGFLDS